MDQVWQFIITLVGGLSGGATILKLVQVFLKNRRDDLAYVSEQHATIQKLNLKTIEKLEKKLEITEERLAHATELLTAETIAHIQAIAKANAQCLNCQMRPVANPSMKSGESTPS